MSTTRPASSLPTPPAAGASGADTPSCATDTDFVSEHAARVGAEAALFARDRVLSIVSHDLRGPLNAIHSWAHVLERKLASDDPGIIRAIAGIRTGVEQQVKLIEEVIDKTRTATRNLTVTRVPVAVQDIVDTELAHIRATLAAPRAVTIDTDLALGGVTADLDRERYGQAVWVLLAYAVETVVPGGVVLLSAHADNNRIEVSVSFAAPPTAAEPAVATSASGFFTGPAAALDGGMLPLALPARIAAVHDGELLNETLDDGRRRIGVRHPQHAGRV